MKKLSQIVEQITLKELTDAIVEAEDLTVLPKPKPKDEKLFVAFHKVEKHPDRLGNKPGGYAGKVKEIDRPATRQGHKAGDDNKDTAFSPVHPVPEETQLHEDPLTAAAVGLAVGAGSAYVGSKVGKWAANKFPYPKSSLKKAFGKRITTVTRKKSGDFGKPRTHSEETEVDEGLARYDPAARRGPLQINRRKVDSRGNVILAKADQKKIQVGKPPRGKGLTGRPFKPVAEETQLDERSKGSSPFGTKSKTRIARQKAGPNFPEKTVLVSPKGYKGSGKVQRIKKSQYDPAKHSLAEDQIDELSTGTLSRYTKVAAASAVGAAARHEFGKAARRVTGINKAQDRLTGTYEVGKPRKYMVPGDESNKVYSAKKKKLYHPEETQLDEKLTSRTKKFRSGLERDAGDAKVRKFQAGGFSPEKWKALKKQEAKEKSVKEETQLDEVITSKTPAGDVIHDFVHSSNKKFSGDDKKQRIKRALGAYYGMHPSKKR